MTIPLHSRVLAKVVLAPTLIKPWYAWPPLIGGLGLLGIRYQLRHKNLVDTRRTAPPEGRARRAMRPEDRIRSADGSRNDLNDPKMGVAWGRFGRNVPLDHAWPDPEPRLLEPNPREVSNRLLARKEFIPATSLNVLAAAWIQFQVHGWFSHGDNEREDPFELPLAEDDPWPERPMRIRRTQRDPTHTPEDGPPTFRTAVTHWWDSSQIYGSSVERQQELRSGVDGKLLLVERPELGHPLLPVDETLREGIDLTGFNDNWWLGLCLLHTLFAREHNAICDRLREEYPQWDDERLFHTARLINNALMAKIHTVEWTPALLDTPTLHLAMNANWSGALPGWFRRLVPHHFGEAASGILGSKRAHDGVPYSLTEEFVAVYRMHPLIPDDYSFRRLANDAPIAEKRLNDIQGRHTRPFVEDVPMQDLWYSLGTSHPGAIVLQNYPNQLRDFRKFEAGEEIHIDVAAIDVLRDRERGVPRYNEFRRQLRLKPKKTFEELCADPELREELRDVYDNDIERVDTMIGMFAETPPPGFAFSETAFRIFAVMASRRLSSDRFFTDDYRPEIYTKAGMDWIAKNSLLTVLRRHYPELVPALEGLPHAFAPWHRAACQEAPVTSH